MDDEDIPPVLWCRDCHYWLSDAQGALRRTHDGWLGIAQLPKLGGPPGAGNP